MIDDAVREPADTGTVDAENPWPGLAAFREADQPYFQGRETVVDELTRMVLRARVTVLHGVSGLGKTSLLQAGLFPRLRREHVLPIYVRVNHAEDSPPAVAQVRDAILRASQAGGVEAPPSTGQQTLWEYFHRRDAQFWDARNRIVTPLLVFDQFEELFTLGRASAARRTRSDAFVAELADLVEGRPAAHVRARLEQDPEEALRYSMSDQPCKVLLSLREDFLPDLAELRSSMPAITDTMYRLQPMTAAEALQVVEVGGRLVDHDVAERIVTFVASARSESAVEGATAVVEPALLSVFCRELNNKRRAQGGARITADLLEGSRTAIISDFYERTISEGGLSPALRLFVEERLLTESGFRDSVAEEQALRTPGISPPDIETLIARRLLRREDAGTRERSRLELTHDVLADAVRASRDRRRLREQQERAIAERREVEERLRREADEAAAREQQRREFEAAQTLAAKEQEAAALARALALEEQRGREAAERLAHAERRARRRQIALLSILLVVTGTLAAAALYWASRAVDAGAATNRALSAAYVDRVTRGEPWTLPLLARAVRLDPDSTMARSLLVGHLTQQVIERAEIVHEAPVRIAMLNSTGSRLLTISGRGMARLWDPRTGQAVGEPLGQPDHTVAGAFSPDGTRLATASEDGSARVWDAESGAEIGVLHHQAGVTAVSFDPAGRRVLTASDDQTVHLWDPERGDDIEIAAASGPIVDAMFDPTGTFVLSRSVDGDAAVWEAGSGSAVSRFGLSHGDAAAITDAAFGPDGSRIISVVIDGTARIVDTRTGLTVGRALEEPQPEANEPRGTIRSVRLDPTGTRALTTSLAAAAGEGTGIARLWDAATGEMLPFTMRHGGLISTAAFSRDGSRILTASRDGTARIWSASTGVPLGALLQHGRPVVWAGFSPDGRRVLTASEDGTAQLWDAQTGLPIGAALRHDGPVGSGSFSGDGAMVVTSSRNLTRTWDARTGGAAETRLRHAEGLLVTVAALSADGTLVATAGSLDPNLPAAERARRIEEENVVQVWEAATGQALGGPLRHGGPINSIRFEPAGALRLVTASKDGTARLWDARGATPVGAALQHRGPVYSAGFSADGSQVLTASADGTARVWDASSGRALAEFSHCDGGQCAEVRSAAFNPDATRVVTGASDGHARVWNVATGALIETLSSACDEAEPADEGPPVTSVSYSTDGTRLLTSSDRQSLLRDGESLAPIMPCVSHEGARNLPVFSRNRPGDGLELVTTSTIDAARVWDVSPELVTRWELPRDREVLAAAFSGDGRLVTVSQDGSARIWNVRTGQETGLVLHHGTELGWTTFSSDGSRILTLAADGIARLWDVPSGNREDAEPLAALADAVSGHTLDAAGVHRLDKAKAQAAVRQRAAMPPSAGSFADAFARWLFADPATREISPLSRVTVPHDTAGLHARPGRR